MPSQFSVEIQSRLNDIENSISKIKEAVGNLGIEGGWTDAEASLLHDLELSFVDYRLKKLKRIDLEGLDLRSLEDKPF